MGGFLAEECDREISFDRSAPWSARIAIQARRNIDGNDRNACGIYLAGKVDWKIAAKPRAIESVDDKFSMCDVVADFDGPSPLLKIFGSNATVFAIVAGATKDNSSSGTVTAGDFFRDGTACIVDEFFEGQPPADRQLISVVHLFRCEKFSAHCLGLPACPWADPSPSTVLRTISRSGQIPCRP